MIENTTTILIFFAVGIGAILFFVNKWIKDLKDQAKVSNEVVEWLKDVGERIDTSNKNIDSKLGSSMEQFNTRLDRAAEIIGKVQKNIGEFSEIGRGMRDLQEFLKSPKIRGNIGEAVLKDLLEQLLPKSNFKMQYRFKGGEIVDAVIKTSRGFIPIDSKFPMENFRKMVDEEDKKNRKSIRKEFDRDVKKHIRDISSKYIQVSQDTVDYALMYIPSESVYYEIINNQQLYEYAGCQRVLIVSPMSFYAYLHVILMSHEGQRIEERAKEILSLLRSLQNDYEKADAALSILNSHMTNAYNQLQNVSKFFLGFGQKLNASRLLEKEKIEAKLKE